MDSYQCTLLLTHAVYGSDLGHLGIALLVFTLDPMQMGAGHPRVERVPPLLGSITHD